MKKHAFTFLFLLAAIVSIAQNIGVDVTKPSKKFSVNGTIVVDHENKNNGTLDSASLLFGVKPAGVGINSNMNPFQPDYRGMNFWTNQQKRLTILENGNIGIGTSNPQYSFSIFGNLYADNAAIFNNSIRVNQRVGIGGNWNGSYRLFVHNGNAHFEDKVHIGSTTVGADQLFVQSPNSGTNAARFAGGNVLINESLLVEKNATITNNITGGGNLTMNGNAFIGGAPDFTYRMRIYGNARVDDNFRVNGKLSVGGVVDNIYTMRVYGNARIDDNFRVEAKAAIGGNVDENFKLRVYGGNSRFGGDVEVTGNLNVNSIAIADNFSIGGKGSVKSNGTSPLKIHFTEVFADHLFKGSGELAVFKLYLPDFDHVSDVRLFISHFETNIPVGYNPQNVLAYFSDLDPVENTAMFVLRSLRSEDFIIGGTYYITAIIKDN